MSTPPSSILLLLSLISLLTPVTSFFQYGCPHRGCSPRGTYALSAPVPPSPPSVRWSWTDNSSSPQDFTDRGCSSSFATLTCPTYRGYVNFDFATGQTLWQTSGYEPRPFLPLVDFFGNALTSDTTTFKLLWWDGSTQAEVNLTNFRPEFGAVMANSSVMVITSSDPSTDQLMTYNTGGIVFASTRLTGTMSGVSGTYVPCAPPVVNVMRVYLLTRFVPDRSIDTTRPPLDPAHRLYAIDLSGDSQTPNHVVWHQDLPGQHGGFLMPRPVHYFRPVVVYNNGSVYINSAGELPDTRVTSGQAAASSLYSVRDLGSSASGQPVDSSLYSVRDLGSSAHLDFHTSSAPGQLAVYDVTQSWDNTTATGLRPVWVVSPHTLTAHHPTTGAVLVTLDIAAVAPGLGEVTSKVMVTRSAALPALDVLVLATQDTRGHAFLLALEAGLPPHKPRLLWSHDVSGGSEVTSRWRVSGQIASVALTSDGGWEYGLAVSVVEHRVKGHSSVQHVMVLV